MIDSMLIQPNSSFLFGQFEKVNIATIRVQVTVPGLGDHLQQHLEEGLFGVCSITYSVSGKHGSPGSNSSRHSLCILSAGQILCSLPLSSMHSASAPTRA